VSSERRRNPHVVVVDRERISRAACQTLREQAWYGGDEARVYAFIHDGDIAALCCYWFGKRYLTRNFWPLQEGEAKLVQVITSPNMRGKGIATELITTSAADMFAEGFETLYARVWFSNRPSMSAFAKSGWRRIGHVIELQAYGMKTVRKFIIRGRKD
jgi:RimJ/RimL family protein N-acetyltransferase